MDKKNIKSVQRALFITFSYLVAGIVWIYFSDTAVDTIASKNNQITLLQTYKGIFFILTTGLMLYLLSYRFFQQQYLEYTHYIKEHETQQTKLNQKHALLNTIVESSPDAIFVKDLEGKYILFNKGSATLSGIPSEKAIGQTDEILFSSETALKIRQDDSEILQNRNIVSYEENLITASGNPKTSWITKGPLLDEKGEPFGIFGISRDITERKKYEEGIVEAKERFDRLAHHDPLTGLPNRLSLIETLNDKVTDSSPFSLLFLDLDEFQQINDSYGHRFGDKLLIEVSQLLKKVFHSKSYIVRTGGDEFVIIMEHDKDHSSLFSLLNHLIDDLSHPINIDGVDVYSTFSIGIADYPKDANSAENLLQCADAAMYKAKKMGKNTFYLYSTDLIQKALYRTTITSNLKKGLDNGDLKLHYQPQVDPYTDKIIGYEALLRWETPEGSISPALFIPICEESGLIQDVGKFVLLEGCKTAVLWENTGILHGQIAINVSARQLIHPDFLLTLDQIIEETQCPPFCIELEITESSILENPEKMISLLSIIKSKGFKISIDDFGTGYSSLSYLKHLPIDKLKIDISFIRNITMEPKNQTIVKTIIALAKGLGMEVLAEGVESIEETTFLRDNGIDSIQGYYYYKPMEKASIVKLLQ